MSAAGRAAIAAAARKRWAAVKARKIGSGGIELGGEDSAPGKARPKEAPYQRRRAERQSLRLPKGDGPRSELRKPLEK